MLFPCGWSGVEGPLLPCSGREGGEGGPCGPAAKDAKAPERWNGTIHRPHAADGAGAHLCRAVPLQATRWMHQPIRLAVRADTFHNNLWVSLSSLIDALKAVLARSFCDTDHHHVHDADTADQQDCGPPPTKARDDVCNILNFLSVAMISCWVE